ncbi:hypothetical protein HPB47_023074, partial [Ixodes persulcatus]
RPILLIAFLFLALGTCSSALTKRLASRSGELLCDEDGDCNEIPDYNHRARVCWGWTYPCYRSGRTAFAKS